MERLHKYFHYEKWTLAKSRIIIFYIIIEVLADIDVGDVLCLRTIGTHNEHIHNQYVQTQSVDTLLTRGITYT